jgi:hypothetical protein
MPLGQIKEEKAARLERQSDVNWNSATIPSATN